MISETISSKESSPFNPNLESTTQGDPPSFKIKQIQKDQVKLDPCDLRPYLVKRSEPRIWEFPGLDSSYISYDEQSENEIDYEVGTMLAAALKSAKKIQQLELNCAEHNLITDTELRLIFRNVNRLTCLKSLVLHCGGCEKITNEGLKNMSEGLRRLTSLQFVSLTFDHCVRITDESLKILGEGLKGVTFLQTLSLRFFECLELSGKDLKNLIQGLRKLASLKTINLIFYQ